MSHAIAERARARMAELEERGARDCSDVTPRMERPREVSREVGRSPGILAARSSAMPPTQSGAVCPS